MSISETQSKAQILEELFNKAKPKSRYISESHIEEQINSISKEIINGDIEVRKTRGNLNRPGIKNDYEEMLRRRFIEQIEKQKQRLQQKLGYIENSLSTAQKHQYLKKRSNSPKTAELDAARPDESWRKQYKEKLKKIEQKKREIAQKEKQRQREIEQLQAKIKQQEQTKKKAQISQNMKRIKNRMEQREQSSKRQNQKVKQIVYKKQLFQKMEEKYYQKQQTVLQQRKKKLAEIRKLRQPINIQQILQHEQRVSQIKKQKDDLRQREKKMNDSRTRNYRPSYESVFYKQIAEHKEEEEPQQGKQKLQKMRQFSQHVKNKFVPEIDQRKRKQIEQQIEREAHQLKNRVERDSELRQKPKIKGLQYLQLVKKLPKRKKSQSKLQSPKTQRIVYQNYLGVNQSMDVGKPKPWKTILNRDAQKVDTALLLRFESEKLQEKLRRKQEYSKIMKIKDDGTIDQQYYEMVKAKLDLLAKQ